MRITTELNFDIIHEIGSEGANSQAYYAYDPQLGANIVAKGIAKADFEGNIDNYFNESKILYAMKHPNIMEIYYSCQTHDTIFVSMPFHSKGSLNSLINTRFLTVREIIQYSLDFLGALHYIHSKGLIHFDVKPTNIIINDANIAILTDFGLSNYVDINGFATVEKVYPTHWTPELFATADLTSQYDIYQSGLTIYRMCNGNEDFKKQSQIVKTSDDISKSRFPNRKTYLPHIPKKLRTIINNALKVDTDKRYKTILDMMNDLSGIDQNLDWKYNSTEGVETWSLESANTIRSIIKFEKAGKWHTRGESYSKNTNKTTRIIKWISESDNESDCDEKIMNFFE